MWPTIKYLVGNTKKYKIVKNYYDTLLIMCKTIVFVKKDKKGMWYMGGSSVLISTFRYFTSTISP
jgi:hypothetical protein